MLAVPVKTVDAADPVVAALYGNAEFFALIDEQSGEFSVVANPGQGNGIDTGKFLLTTGADASIYIHLGQGPFKTVHEGGMKVFYLGKNEMPLSQAVALYNGGKLPEVTMENMKELLDPGTPQGECQCGCEES